MIENDYFKAKEQAQKLKDFDMLSELMEGKVRIEELDYDLKLRLIKLCEERKIKMNERIEKKENEVTILENFLNKIYKN